MQVRGTIANTDQEWFDFLSRESFDEVNFWAPSGRASGKSMPLGSPFFFKLKSPHNAIAGFGFLGPISSVPLSLAWEAFGPKNGVPDLQAMVSRIHHYRSKGSSQPAADTRRLDPPVGCRTILEPVFFPQDLWIEQPRDWAKNIVTSKHYDLTSGEGARVWRQCQTRARLLADKLPTTVKDRATTERWGSEQLVRPRLGQGAFRLAVTDAYGRACAVTGEHSLPVLDSAHIQPYAEGGPHEVSNGLLLRTDLHRLYDRGYVTVTADFEFKVSDALRDEYDNGKVYYELEQAAGERRKIRTPASETERPNRELLAWHGRAVYRG
jgi:HNH endonuclease